MGGGWGSGRLVEKKVVLVTFRRPWIMDSRVRAGMKLRGEGERHY